MTNHDENCEAPAPGHPCCCMYRDALAAKADRIDRLGDTIVRLHKELSRTRDAVDAVANEKNAEIERLRKLVVYDDDVKRRQRVELARLRETGLRMFQYVDIQDVEVCDLDAWQAWFVEAKDAR